jgi:hypothetical protein
MKSGLVLLLAAVPVLACSGSGTSGPPNTESGTLVVIVSAQDGAAVVGADVRVSPGNRSQRTDDEGRARFAELTAGSYVVTVEVSGSLPVEQSIQLRPPSSELRVTLGGVLRIEGDGLEVDWGAPESLRAVLTSGTTGEILWISTRDLHLDQPVELGRGASVPTTPLRPGATVVEARLVQAGQTVATARATVHVRYRESWNVDRLGLVSYPDRTVGDVWLSGRHALVARRGAGGISIVDVDQMTEVGRFSLPGTFTQDVHAVGTRAFAGDEGVHPHAATIIDISDPTAPRELGGVPDATTPSSHTVWAEGSTLYVASPPSRLIHVWDVSDPAAPRRLSTVAASTRGVAHDMYVRNGVLYGAYMGLGGGIAELVVASVTDPANPVIRAQVTYPNAFLTHSTWLSADGRYLYVADEVVNAPIRIFDVQNPSNPVLVGTYQPRLGTVPHHFQVQDSRIAYLADYKNGVEVVDVSDPVRPRLIGFYDTHVGAATDGDVASGISDPFQGAWGVHWTDDGRIVVSDMNRGLFVLSFRD